MVPNSMPKHMSRSNNITPIFTGLQWQDHSRGMQQGYGRILQDIWAAWALESPSGAYLTNSKK